MVEQPERLVVQPVRMAVPQVELEPQVALQVEQELLAALQVEQDVKDKNKTSLFGLVFFIV
jgi:hypothetical protein